MAFGLVGYHYSISVPRRSYICTGDRGLLRKIDKVYSGSMDPSKEALPSIQLLSESQSLYPRILFIKLTILRRDAVEASGLVEF